MIPLLKQLGLAQHTYVNLCRDLIGVLRVMLPIPATDWLYVSMEIFEEAFSRNCDMAMKVTRIVATPEQHQVIELQQGFESLTTEEVHIVLDNCIKKLIRSKHVLPYCIREIVTPNAQQRINIPKMMLDITQFVLDPSEVQSQVSQGSSSSDKSRFLKPLSRHGTTVPLNYQS